MIGSSPSFPAFDEWQKMTEKEQDALIGRIEAAQRRKAFGLRIVFGLAGASVLAAAIFAMLG